MRYLRVQGAWCFFSLLFGSLVWSPAFAQEEVHSIGLSQFNGTYRDLATNLEPIRQNGLEIHISSPRHRLTIHGNRVQLTATDYGTFKFLFEADFDGEGDLIADVVFSTGSSTRFSDQVSARRQRARATGEVTLAAHERGFLFTVVESGTPARLEIESSLVQQVVGLCGVFSLLPMMNLDCEGLGKAMARIRVPLPEAGSQFVLPAESLTAEERGFFGRLVGAGGA